MAGVHQEDSCLVRTPALPRLAFGEPSVPLCHCMQAPERRDGSPTFLESCSTHLCRVHGARERPQMSSRNCIEFGVRMGKTSCLFSCFQVEGDLLLYILPCVTPSRGAVGK